MRLLCFREDRRTLCFVALTLCLLIVPYFWPVPGMLAPVWLMLSCAMCFVASIAAHNHLHHDTFRLDSLNRAFNIALSLARGHTASGIVVPHNLNHHIEAGSEADWIRPGLSGSGLGWFRLLRYVLCASINMLVRRVRVEAPRLDTASTRRWLVEKAMLTLYIVTSLIVDWRTFGAFNLLPWLAGLLMLVGVNLLQHDRCHPEVAFGESRNFVGSAGNWLFLNNGFHTAHHLDPERHWSLLPHLHAQLRARLSSNDLEHSSIVVYLWHFGWSRSNPGIEGR